ncbi:MAG: hypothetical protein J5I53_09100 [Bradyrhizobiaceae bacterium]|nr:hypothetical protein [Bradyrhizobiaceae bacterium]
MQRTEVMQLPSPLPIEFVIRKAVFLEMFEPQKAKLETLTSRVEQLRRFL